MAERVEIAIVGGGPAGATLAILLARSGHDVVVLERAVVPRWRACGVFSPTALPLLGGLGILAPEPALATRSGPEPALVRRLPGLRLEVPDAPPLDLFGHAAPAGFARPAFDAALLAAASHAGARVEAGVEVAAVSAPTGGHSRLDVRGPDGHRRIVEADLVVGADGIRSVVARAAGVVVRPRLAGRVALTFHVAEPASGDPRFGSPIRPARMIVFDGGYCGLAPVPGGRLNAGIVLHGRPWLDALHREGAAAVAQRVLASIPPGPGDGTSIRMPSGPTDATGGGVAPGRGDAFPSGAATGARVLDAVAGAFPLSHAVRRAAGSHWLLVGDAAGFLDPFTGDGLDRALVSAALAADAIAGHQRGRRDAFASYADAIHERFEPRDRLSLLLQAFVARPSVLAYALRRVARREALRRTIDLVLADRLPASRALDPRFLAAVLAP